MHCILVIIVIKTVFADFNRNTSEVFTIRTEGCTIPAFPKNSESIKKLVGPPRVTQDCSTARRLVSSNSSHIWVVQESLHSFDIFREDVFYCCYKNFSAQTHLSNIIYGDCKEFSSVIKVEHEFIRIECYYLDDKIYDDYFLFGSNETVIPTSDDEESYNILILGIESMSRLNFHRTMPLTANFVKERGMVELLGYNKLGDNSYPNLFPILTGLSFDYVKKTCIHNYIINIDKCGFIWDKFKDNGYLTALGSDSIAGLLGTYEYTLPKIPTDFYLQPFISETRNLFKDRSYAFHQCMGTKLYYKILLNYIYGLTQQFKLNRLFGMFWEESISHEDLNSPHVMDESYYNFLINLDEDNYLNKTIIILLSDHGMRWGKILGTDQGRLESSLPLLGILFPDQFTRRYKVAFRNIQENAHQLTTPFDIYETLLDLLNPGSLHDSLLQKRSDRNTSVDQRSSLFLPVSARRNCSSMGIAEHWCACRRGNKTKTGSKVKAMAAGKLLDHINKLLKNYPQCRKLILDHVYDVYLIENSKQWRIYTVMIKTSPGDGIFDGTLLRHGKRWVISGTVSRLNLYRNQSDCVNDVAVKMYCYCS